MSRKRLALGTVQFGLPYGIANRGGQVDPDTAAQIISGAREAGLSVLDTAIAYGDSEKRLGQIGVREWRVISKLPALPAECTDVTAWVRESVAGSLTRLKVPALHGLLLHRSSDLIGPHGAPLYASLTALQNEGTVEKIGVSIYGPDELDALWGKFQIDMVQAPYNVLDRRLMISGWFEKLTAARVAVYARSAFLQGLLVMPADERPSWTHRWDALWQRWARWLAEAKVTPLEACLHFALSPAAVDRVVVGVDSLDQLTEILTAAERPRPLPPDDLKCDDLDLIDPTRWMKN